MHISKPVEFRVCMLGKTDKHIEAQHNAGDKPPQVGLD